MGKPEVTLWLMPRIEIFVRYLLCILNVTLWLFVLYFSTHEDKTAAVLSYFAVMVTVMMIKYGFREIKISESFACVVDAFSKTLILSGISLALLSQFWNTAFYSICLGIMIQKMKYEIELASLNVGLSLNAKEIYDDGKTESSDVLYNELETHLEFHDAGTIKENLKGKMLSNISRIADVVKKLGEIIHEVCSSDKTNSFLHICKIPDIYKKNLLPYIQKFQCIFPKRCNEEKSILHAENTKNIKGKGEKIESGLDQVENVLKPRTDSTNVDIENRIKEVASLFVLKAQILNVQELELNECSKADFKSDETINERELKRNKEMNNDSSEKLIALNDKTLKLPKDDIKRMDCIKSTTESLNEQESKLQTGYPQIKVNICSSVGIDIKKSTSNSDEHNYLHHENEIKDEFKFGYVDRFQDEINSLNISGLDTVLQTKQSSARSNADAVIEREKIFLNKCDLQRGTSVVTNRNSDSNNESETMYCKTENMNIQPNIKCEYQTSEVSNVENLKADLDKHDSGSFLKPGNSVSKAVLNPCNVSYTSPSVDNESAAGDEDRKVAKELVKEQSEEIGATKLSEVSNIKGVVNEIDLGFIYSLGYNVPV